MNGKFSIDSKNHYKFLSCSREIVEMIIDYKKDVMTYDINPKDTEFGRLSKQLPGRIPEEAEEFENVLKDFREKILPNIMHWNNPNFMAYYPAPNSTTGVLAEIVASGLGCMGYDWISDPACAELEDLMADWYAQLLQLPNPFLRSASHGLGGGVMQPTATDALYCCVLAARQKMLREAPDSYKHEMFSKFVIYASEEAHVSVFKVSKMENIKLHLIPSSDGRMASNFLIEMVEQDIKSGFIPLLAVLGIMTFPKCGTDDVLEIAEQCARKFPKLWLHVDASFGGNALALSRYEKKRYGLHLVDSIVADASHWMDVAFDCTMLWLKDTKSFQEAFNPDCLTAFPEIYHPLSYRDQGLALSRKCRALKLWFTFHGLGSHGIKELIRGTIRMRQTIGSILKKSRQIQILMDKFTIIVFKLRYGGDKDNIRLLKEINDSNKVLLMPVKFDGNFAIRLSVNSMHLKLVDVVLIADRILQVVESYSLRYKLKI